MSKAQKIIILILAAALVAVSILAWVTLGREPDTVAGQFTAPALDPAALAGRPDVPAELGWSELPVREGYSVRVSGELAADGEGRVPVWFYSDGENQVWVKLRMLDGEGNVLGETGVLRPGEYVQAMTLSTVPKRTGPVTLVVVGYEPETYYSAGSVSLSTTLRIP